MEMKANSIGDGGREREEYTHALADADDILSP